MIEGYKMVKGVVNQWKIKSRTLQTMCASGKVPGAVKSRNTRGIRNVTVKPENGRKKWEVHNEGGI